MRALFEKPIYTSITPPHKGGVALDRIKNIKVKQRKDALIIMKKKLFIFLAAACLVAGQMGGVNAYATDTLPSVGSTDTGTDTSDTDTSDTASDTYSTDTDTTDTQSTAPSDDDMQIALDENNQATFQTTMKSGVNRFEILYSPSDKTPVVEFAVNGNIYEAAYGGQVSDDNPITILKGKEVTLTKRSNSQYAAKMYLMAIYFDTDKISLADGTAVDITVNLPNERTAFIFARTEVPFLWTNIADGEETRDKLLSTDDPYFLLKYSLASQNEITSDDIVPVITETDNETNSPETTKPPKPDKNAERIKFILVCTVIFTAAVLLLVLHTKKTNQAVAAKRNEKRKAKRKRQEQEVRDRDRLSSALKEFEDEYTDDGYSEANENDIRNYYENEADTDMDTAESEGMSQIPQADFPEYSTGIKEALFTIGPEEEERLKKKREELIKERKESIREAENGDILKETEEKEKPGRKASDNKPSKARIITEHEKKQSENAETEKPAAVKTVKAAEKVRKVSSAPKPAVQTVKPVKTVKPAAKPVKPVRRKPGSVKITLNATPQTAGTKVSENAAGTAKKPSAAKKVAAKPSASAPHKPAESTAVHTKRPVTKAPVSRNRMQTKGTLPGKNARIGGNVKIKPVNYPDLRLTPKRSELVKAQVD